MQFIIRDRTSDLRVLHKNGIAGFLWGDRVLGSHANRKAIAPGWEGAIAFLLGLGLN